MKMFLISDNVDTLTGMRLAGVEGCIVHDVRNFVKHWKMRLPIKKTVLFS